MPLASFDYCIDLARSQGKITAEVANQLSTSRNPEAELQALTQGVVQQKREAIIQAVRISRAWENISGHEKGAYEGLLSILSKDRTGKADYDNVELAAEFHRGKYHARLAGMLQRFRTRKLGFEQDEEGLQMLIRSIYGEQVPDGEIARFGKDWEALIDDFRLEFNDMGGNILKNERYLLPQNHDARAIEKVGKDRWMAEIKPKLDRYKMLDEHGNPLTDEQLHAALDTVYESITTGGLNKLDDLTIPRMGKKLSRKHSDARFLYFKDADSWIEYQKTYGKGDVFATLTGHVDTMGHDLALMEILGPSPESAFQALLAQTKKETGIKGRKAWFAEAIYNNVSGKTNQGELTSVADFVQATRNMLTASTLGKAFLSAVSDVGFQAVTSQYNGLPMFKVLGRHMALMTNEESQVFAVKMGLVAEAMVNRLHAANRYADVYGVGLTAKLAEGVMRASLLAPWTDAGRKAFGMEFSSTLADNFGRSMDQLDKNMVRAFETYGITGKDWDEFRKSKLLDHNGAQFADFTQPGGRKFHQMVLSETDYAVPTPDAKVQAITNGGLGRASIEGQAWRSAMMLKSFPATIIMTHFYRFAYQATTTDRLKYMSAILATTTVLGGVALQMKDMAAGREPRPMDGKFIPAALVQGGGLGILGDFVFSDQNRFGGGITETLTGPMGELANKTAKLTVGNLQQAIKGEETNVLGETVEYLNRYTPDVWQTHLFTNAFFDQLEMLADSSQQKRFRRTIKKRKKDYDQGYWWRPGEATPEFMQ